MPSHDDPRDIRQGSFRLPIRIKRGDSIDMAIGVNLRILLDANISPADTKLMQQAILDAHLLEEAKAEFKRLRGLNDFATARLEQLIAEKQTNPPSSILLSLMMPPATSEEIIANMEDLYHDNWVPRHGKCWADWIWRWQVVQFIAWRWSWPVLWLIGAVKALIKFG